MTSEAPAPADAPRTLAGGRYVLLEELGRGGMAIVYRAIDTQADSDQRGLRAIKVLTGKHARRRKTRQRLENEAATMMGLSHPNVVQVHELYVSDSELFIVMELLPGGSVWERLQQLGQLTPHVASTLVEQVLAGLEVAHQNGVVHRDIKPHNILLDAEGQVKITDFGIARLEDSGLTKTGVVMGTMAYMPPEQKLSARRVDARADIYAVGAMLWACLTGREPHDLYAAGMDDDVAADYYAGLPEPLVQVIRTATRFSPEARYHTAADMGVALTAARESLPAPTEAAPPLVDAAQLERMASADAVAQQAAHAVVASATFPEDSVALTPILPPRRSTANDSREAKSTGLLVAFGMSATLLGSALFAGALIAGGAWWWWSSAAADGRLAVVELPEQAPATRAPAVDTVPEPVPADAEAVEPSPLSAPRQAPKAPAPPAPAPQAEPAADEEPEPPPPMATPDDDPAVAAADVRITEVHEEPEVIEVAPTPPAAPAPAPPPPEPVPEPAPAASAARSGGWVETTFPGVGSKPPTIVLTLEADAKVRSKSGDEARPKVVLACASKKTQIWFDPGMATEMVFAENGMDSSFTKVTINGDLERLSPANAADQTALALKPTKRWAADLLRQSTWVVAFSPFGSAPVQVSFPLTGLDSLRAQRFDQYCKR